MSGGILHAERACVLRTSRSLCAFREGETRNVDVTLAEMPEIALPIVLEMFRVSCFLFRVGGRVVVVGVRGRLRACLKNA